MKKRLLSLALVLVMVFALLPISALAAEIVASGTCGDNVTWKLDSDGTLTISGTGAMYDYGEQCLPDNTCVTNALWGKYYSDIKSVIVENGVTSIGEESFYGCSSLTSVAIPNSVTSIERYAFYGCSTMTSVTIPDSVTKIGEGAFTECNNLVSVTIPNDVTSIERMIFGGCSNLISVIIPNSVTSIGEFAFSGCYSLTNIDIPDSVTSIGEETFGYCSSLTNVNIPDSVTSIGDRAFIDCYSLASVTIPGSVTSIGEDVFAYCSGLTSIHIPDSVTSIGSSAFFYCSGLTTINIPDSVTSIGIYAFYSCSRLKDVLFAGTKEEWTAIGYDFSSNTRVHYNCTSLEDHYIPVEIEDATCYSDGHITHCCDCGYEYTETIPQNHDYTVIKTVGPTCTSHGYDVIECGKCGDTKIEYYEDELLPHNYEESVIQPTCITGGYTLHKCLSCGDSYKNKLIKPLGHNYVNGACTRCGDVVIAIIKQPGDISAVEGKTISFSVHAKGEGLSYQWQYSKNSGKTWLNSTSASATTDTVSVKATATRDGQMYRCVITDANGNTVTSDAAKLSIGSGEETSILKITAQPESKTVKENSNATFTVAAEGENLTYQWQYSTNNGKTWKDSGMTGCTTDTIKVKATATRDGQMYRCVVKDCYGNTVTSDAAKLTIGTESTSNIEITQQPENVSTAVGEKAVFTVAVQGEGLNYQWQFLSKGATAWKNSGMTGANTDTLTVKAAANRDGQQYRCVITDANGNTVTSDAAMLSIGSGEEDVSITIAEQPENATVEENSKAIFAVTAEGEGLSYQWQYSTNGGKGWKDSTMTGFDTDALTVKATATRDGQMYRCVITDANGNTITSDAVTLRVS